MAFEIFPNLVSIVGINFIGSVIFAVISEATLEGEGSPDEVVEKLEAVIDVVRNEAKDLAAGVAPDTTAGARIEMRKAGVEITTTTGVVAV